jgi:hypothetical protein
MGAVLAIPLLGSLGGLATTAGSACVTGLAFFCTSQAVRLTSLRSVIKMVLTGHVIGLGINKELQL